MQHPPDTKASWPLFAHRVLNPKYSVLARTTPITLGARHSMGTDAEFGKRHDCVRFRNCTFNPFRVTQPRMDRVPALCVKKMLAAPQPRGSNRDSVADAQHEREPFSRLWSFTPAHGNRMLLAFPKRPSVSGSTSPPRALANRM
jgi:hypothetical protein